MDDQSCEQDLRECRSVPLTTGSGDFLAADGVTASYSRVAGETVLGGPYHITATLSPAAVLTNYSITNAGASFTINTRPATWTTNPASKTYGDADPVPLTTGSGRLPCRRQRDSDLQPCSGRDGAWRSLSHYGYAESCGSV